MNNIERSMEYIKQATNIICDQNRPCFICEYEDYCFAVRMAFKEVKKHEKT